mgnify:CR=1 FL=1
MIVFSSTGSEVSTYIAVSDGAETLFPRSIAYALYYPFKSSPMSRYPEPLDKPLRYLPFPFVIASVTSK